ncbi:MAG: helix-turn-helix transcriptional regulator [Bacteroidales bacterium]|nr:helix-turn-helix transcriptional regulator [Bacteroidales bacterium]
MRQEKLKVEPLPDMHTTRAGHSVFYAGGELTVVGGHTAGFVLTPNAEYYSNGVWHLVPTVYPHDNGMSVVLGDGQRVLLAGGHEKNLGIGQRYEAEMYNAKTHTFEGFGCLDRNRAFSQGVELNNGQVLICGNHKGNDALELYDGQKAFSHAKEVSTWRSSPYVLPIADNNAIVFGCVWRNQHFEPCDTVDRLKGEPFCVPLLKEWMPMLYNQGNHAQAAFIGNKANNDYSYLIAALNLDNEVAFIRIHDTLFSLLSTSCSIPTRSKWGRITYQCPSIADSQTHRAYLVGSDTTGRVYVVVVEYDKHPAPITIYYTDPLHEFGNTTPVLTPDGDLIVTGGITDDNFSPFASVWLLHTGTSKMMTKSNASSRHIWWWLLSGLLIALSSTVALQIRKHRKSTSPVSQETDNTESVEEPQNDSTYHELMNRIVQLMETQHPYLNPELKLSDIADTLGVHRNAISACINSQQGCTFSQFINSYRLQHAQKLLLETNDMKVSAVGMKSGFANERSFFRSFKAATGVTPKEWKEQQTKGI